MNDYWNQFVATVSFATPCEVVGTVEALDEPLKTSDGVRPSILVRLASGSLVRVNAVQERLMEALAIHRPQPGDRIKIVYQGEAKRAAPGMSPTKLFAVEVKRRDSGPGPGTGTPRGSGDSDNGSRAGNKTP